jgi:hypothetical protein
VSDAAGLVMFGLGNGDTDQSYADIEYAIYTYATKGLLLVYEGGAGRGSLGSYAPGDRVRVAVEDGVVKYRKNGVLLYTSTVAPTYPLKVDTSLYSTGATISGAMIGRKQ